MTSQAEEKHLDSLVRQLLDDHDPNGSRIDFLGAQYDLGLAWAHFDEGHGGLGLAPKLQGRVNAKLAQEGAPMCWQRNPIGYGMCGPTVYTHGSEEQKSKYLRPLFTTEEIWCQLFSEPSAGSDVAGLTSRAVKDGDEWIVNGQKVWTTLAHVSRWGCLVTRTDPEAPKHKGLSYFVIDMDQAGVEVRPLRQMTGDAEFNEVYFTNARIPDSERLGETGEGWRVALTTLMNERVAIGGGQSPRGSGPIANSVRLWREMERSRQDSATRDRLMKLWAKAEVARLTNIRASQNRAKGVPGPEGSTGKLAFAENNKNIQEFNVELLGAQGMLYDSYSIERSAIAMRTANTQRGFLRSRANSIEGGTSEVMRNILGERVLGLPGDVRTDKDVPFSEVPNN
ncbi:MAG: acyl-CoA dehydrogenase family protein [Acidimicrobiales bacterium]|jgi:alkylation response protein AidB-like acyl-CoA dehydrogenase|nr:acyl-CoA dehydrogenase family protein [Acidimicrobiales bacterium]